MLFVNSFTTVMTVIGNFLSTNITSILSFAGLCISYFVLNSTIKALNEQNRPFISLSIESIKKPTNLFIVIRNTGNRIAENVVIESNPKFVSYSSINTKTPSIIDIDGVIKLSGIAPNQEIISVFDHGVHRYAKNVKSNDKLSLIITYNYKNKKYVESNIIDFSYLKDASKMSNPEDIDINIKRIADSIESIKQSFEKNDCS